MQQEKIKPVYKIISWILTIVCMALIFWFSSRTSVESQEQSSNLLQWLISIFGDNFFTSFIVRKAAHFLEFTGLGFLFSISLFTTIGVPKPVYAVLFTSVYAATDEFHQLFVEGRSCQLSDWAIDSLGAILGAAAFIVIFCIIRLINNKRIKKHIDTKNN